MALEEPLAGSNVTNVVKVGNTVRRPRKASSEAVQALLRHLRNAGFDSCPEALGFDERDRDVLSLVEGDGGAIPLRAETVTDKALVQHAKLIRQFRDASATFPSSGLSWDLLLKDPSGASEIVCHNDLSIPNTVYTGGLPSALVDWDFAAPGRRLWDLAYAVWWLVPLHRPEFMKAIGWPEIDQPRRLGLFIDAYELGEERANLLDVLRERQLRNRAQLQTWLGAGLIPAYNENDPTVERGRTEYVESIRMDLEAGLGL